MIVSVSIMRRARGVYLVHGSEDADGTEDWDAVATMRAARSWCREYAWHGESTRLDWEHVSEHLWMASVEVEDDDE